MAANRGSEDPTRGRTTDSAPPGSRVIPDPPRILLPSEEGSGQPVGRVWSRGGASDITRFGSDPFRKVRPFHALGGVPAWDAARRTRFRAGIRGGSRVRRVETPCAMTPEFLENLTPLFLQYYELKGAHPGCLLLMQCGDFYEAYGEDAEVFARELEIVLTSKEAGGGRRLAMAGVPLQAIEPSSGQGAGPPRSGPGRDGRHGPGPPDAGREVPQLPGLPGAGP